METDKKFQFEHFEKCAKLVDQSLQDKNLMKVAKILQMMTSVWQKNSEKKFLEIIVIDSSLNISVEILSKVVYSNVNSQDLEIAVVKNKVSELCNAIMMVFKGPEIRLLPEFPKADEVKALENGKILCLLSIIRIHIQILYKFLSIVLLNLCELIEIVKDNFKTFLCAIFLTQKAAIRYASLYYKPCEFKGKLVGILCGQIENLASKLLEDGDDASPNVSKQISFFVNRLIEMTATFQHDHFGAGMTVIELLFWLLKVENTENVDVNKILLVHQTITVGLMGVLKHLYADTDVSNVSLYN